ncbi:MAG: mobilization protein [Candidatus Sedimenticola endophacoides]
MSQIHLVGGEKGGVGKSTVARLLAQEFIDRKHPFAALDGDQSHGDLLRFYSDYANPLNLRDNASADSILLSAIDTDQAVLVDLPAQSATALQSWVQESGVLDLAEELNIPVTFWHVTDGSRNSVDLLQRAVDDFSGHRGVTFVIVRNFGRGGNFEAFDCSEVTSRAQAQGARIIDLPKLDENVMANIDWKGLSFWAAANRVDGDCLSLLDRQRAKAWHRRWQQQLELVSELITEPVSNDGASADVIQLHSAS